MALNGIINLMFQRLYAVIYLGPRTSLIYGCGQLIRKKACSGVKYYLPYTYISLLIEIW